MADDCKDYAYFATNRVAFVTFNYDNVIENYIETVCRNRFNTPHAQPFALHHVYGKIANKKFPDIQVGLANLARESANDIRVIGEVERLKEIDENIAATFFEATTIITIGFGWLPQNVQMLPWQQLQQARLVMGTFGVAPPVKKRAYHILSEYKTIREITECDGDSLRLVRDDIDLITVAKPLPPAKVTVQSTGRRKRATGSWATNYGQY